MTKYYEGTGKDQQEAYKNLTKSAKEAGVTLDSGAVEYTVSVEVGPEKYVGKSSFDYNEAFESVLDVAKASVKTRTQKPGALEVLARAPVASEKTEKKPAPAGASPIRNNKTTVTDLF